MNAFFKELVELVRLAIWPLKGPHPYIAFWAPEHLPLERQEDECIKHDTGSADTSERLNQMTFLGR